MPDPTYYQILGVDPQCSEEEIETVYRSLLAESFDQDGSYKPGAKDTVQVLNAAYVVLTDPVRRKQYDYELYRSDKGAGFESSAELQPSTSNVEIPEWLKETEDYAKIPPAEGDGTVPEWLADLTRDGGEDRKIRSGEQRTARTFIFISLLFFLAITLFVVMMALTR